MIKCDFGKETRISGSPAQIAVELETLMRKTRFALCESLGESGGINFYEEFIRLSKLDDSQRYELFAEEISKAWRENPEIAKMASDLTDELMCRIFGAAYKG